MALLAAVGPVGRHVALSMALYAAGFLLATGALHVFGLALGAQMHRLLKPAWLRALGGGIAVIGAALWVMT